MWKSLARLVVRFRFIWLALVLAITGFMAWQASKVKLSYDFTNAIPTDNPKYQAYQAFRQKFGEDGNLLVVGVESRNFFQAAFFNDYTALGADLKKVPGVKSVISVPAAIYLKRSDTSETLIPTPIFKPSMSQTELDSARGIFLNQPFYRGFLYNYKSSSFLMALSIDGAVLATKERTKVVDSIQKLVANFEQKQGGEVHLSGLPLIRTVMATRIQNEMRYFLVGSVLLSALILLLFFRSVSAMLLSLGVVIIGVIWAMGTLNLLGYKITLLTALIPPLIVVIGIPNCIYFLNKYHTSFREYGEKHKAIIEMVSKMGVVTLFCNIAAAIGFGVFAFTRSTILREFGIVAGINIMLLFIISLLVIPAVLYLMRTPGERSMRYLDAALLKRGLERLERWSMVHRRWIFGVTAVIVVVSLLGIFRLKTVGYIVDDLPKTDKIYTDLKFFEKQFEGVMPLEVVVDTRKKYGVSRNLNNMLKVDSMVQFLASKPYIGKPLSITQGLKFAKQAFFEGDSTFYIMPGENDLLALRPYLSGNTSSGSGFGSLLSGFMDSARQIARISANMKDVGSAQLPLILDSIQQEANRIFDTSKYTVNLTGASVTFLEGSRFIINGLKESVAWAFLLIALCMLYLFRSLRILFCSLLPNIIPLVITAGVMGWVGVALKPSTVLIFSVALGIAIDITIRFLVNYKQQLDEGGDPKAMVFQTIRSTGLSIIYTSIVLIAGFVIFCFSSFGGTKGLGWLTSLTLITATLANLILLPALLLVFYKKSGKKQHLPD